MSNEKSLRHITVPSPCLADWDQMTGNDQIRFCEHCQLHVHNLSKLTYSRAARLVARSQGRLCVRYYRDAKGAPLTKPTTPPLHKIGRRVSRLAAGAFSASMSLSAAVAQNQVQLQSISRLSRSQPDSPRLAATITGTITDPNGAVIAGASIVIFNADNSVSLYTSTNDEGVFRIDGLTSGAYSVRVTAPGFAAQESNGIFVQDNWETKFDLSLSVAGIEASVDTQSGQVAEFGGGAVAYVAPKDPLIKAASEDNLLEVQQLLPGRNVNLRDTVSGTTALEHAVRNGNRELVQLLLLAGADVNAHDAGGRTVLMMLGEEATSDLVWDLLNAGARVNQKDNEGNTPLMEVAGVNNVNALTTLLDAGAEVTDKNEDGETPLMMAAAGGLVNNVRALVLAGADISQLDAKGKSALSLAIENNQSAVIRFLRSQGALETVAQVKEED